jgi:catechol 2,3-dioxygenase-like lactoylglutathione lyase family enzyme
MNINVTKTEKSEVDSEQAGYSLAFDHVALSVKDVNRSAEFYQRAFNLEEIKNRTEKEGIRWFSFGDGRELHLISIYDTDIKLVKAAHFALTTSEFDVFIKNLEALEIPYTDFPGNINQINIRADGIKQVFIQDPDGYWIEVNSVGR